MPHRISDIIRWRALATHVLASNLTSTFPKHFRRLFWPITLSAFAVIQISAQDLTEVVKTDVVVPMRDGVLLRADVLLPDQGGRFPALVYRTPYGKQNARMEYKTFERAVKRGYAVVIQDVRGR